MKNPLVSVIIPVFNGEEFLVEAIQSVKDQSYSPIEIILVDDGSTDSSSEVVKSFSNINYIYQSNLGTPSARNTGINSAQGEFIAFLDADDIWHKMKLEIQVAFHLNHPEIGFSFTKERFFYEDEKEAPNWTRKKVFQEDHDAYCPGSSLTLKTVFSDVGVFNPEFRNGDGTEWTFRAKDKGYKFLALNEVLLFRRIHHNNLSNNVDDEVSYLMKAVKHSIDRQRKDRKTI